MTPPDVTAPRDLPLAEAHRSLGARFAPFAGWEMPMRYGSPIAEHLAVRERAGVFDLSHMGRLRVTGAEAGAALAGALTTNVDRIPVGAARYGLLCATDGGIIDDLMVYRLGDETYLVVCNASRRSVVVPELTARLDATGAVLQDESDASVLLAVQGPEAVAVVTSLGADVDGLGRFKVSPGRLAGLEVTIARTGYTGEDGFEVFVPVAGAQIAWDAILAHRSVTPIGLAARDSLRLEAGLTLYGSDIDLGTNPFDAGLARFVHLDHEFVGADALRALASSPTQELVGLRLDGRRVARGGEVVVGPDGPVGHVTSGVFSPLLDAPIAFARVDLGTTEVGTPLQVTVRDAATPAARVAVPFVARPGTRKQQ